MHLITIYVLKCAQFSRPMLPSPLMAIFTSEIYILGGIPENSAAVLH